jgi:TM2 domain-containing membrane protein YozV
MFCPNCGSQTADNLSFCSKCGAAVGVGAIASDPRMRGSPAGPGLKLYAVDKSPVVALVLSLFIPGVGQFYNGDTKRGLLIFGIWLVSWFLLGAGIGLIGFFVAYIWGMANAYQVAAGKTAIM